MQKTSYHKRLDKLEDAYFRKIEKREIRKMRDAKKRK